MYGALLILLLSASSALAGTVTFDWAEIGNPGNLADTEIMSDGTTGYGAVGYEYSISTTEVTTAQYVEFLNAVGASSSGDDGLSFDSGLYEVTSSSYYGITYNGSEYVLKSHGLDSGEYKFYENKPVTFVSWYDSLRFINWLHNGQPSGSVGSSTTETGAYDLTVGDATIISRSGGALYWLPSENEWYKAAYYSPGGTYYDYATGSNDAPTAGVDANYNNVVSTDPKLTDVGEYDNESPYGTYDQNGNVWEWNEALIGNSRGMRGGGWGVLAIHLPASFHNYLSPTYELYYLGFRVASSLSGNEGGAVPEPFSIGLLLCALVGLVLRRAKKA